MARARAVIETIERKSIDAHRLYGVVVAESAKLLLLHREYDFQFDGFHVVRQRDITARRTSASNMHCARLMRLERLWRPVPRWVRGLPVDDWEGLMRRLVGKVLIAENERRDDFHIGPLLGVERRQAIMHWFDGCGRLGEIERVRLDRLTRVQIATRYAEVHARHLTPPRQARRAPGAP